MIGTVWEWTSDWYTQKHEADAPKACCIPEKPARRRRVRKLRSLPAEYQIPRKVIKGGSHLCAPNYCRRYRPAARHAEAVDTSTSHCRGFGVSSGTGNEGIAPMMRLRHTIFVLSRPGDPVRSLRRSRYFLLSRPGSDRGDRSRCRHGRYGDQEGHRHLRRNALTKQGSPDLVPPAERIATFDNDGTLWAEQPIYFQLPSLSTA